ncbi:MAG TPA: DUF1015 domain-containing protein, partial [bacterium]|nr:DUF1015 domain-containing protein [bacterium]
MSIITPFKGFRYSKGAGSIGNLIAPPYDVINSDYRKLLAARSPYNIVHLTLPEFLESDYHSAVAEKLNNWCNEKILVQDTEKKYYILTQTFHHKNKIIQRTGFIALLDLSYSNKIIKHEVIFNKYRDDRIKLLDITKSNLEPIFLLYSDKENLLDHIAEKLSYPVHADFEDYTIGFTDSQPEMLAELIKKIEPDNLFIADGHHRFQASYEYYQQNPRKAPRYIMCYFTNLFSDSLLILPTHRAVKQNINQDSKMGEILQFFEIKNHKSIQDVLMYIEKQQSCSFGVFFNGNFQTWSVKNIDEIKNFLPEHYSDEWKSLDVVILHYFILQKFFNIPVGEKLYYNTNPEYIVKKIETNEYNIGFFMRAPDIMKIRQVSL